MLYPQDGQKRAVCRSGTPQRGQPVSWAATGWGDKVLPHLAQKRACGTLGVPQLGQRLPLIPLSFSISIRRRLEPDGYPYLMTIIHVISELS